MAIFERASRSWGDDPALDLADLIQCAANEVRTLG
jgi:hypothetical protein